MKISIVIRTFNEERFLKYLLSGLQKQTIKDIEVIVVDSGSTDQTVEIARGFGARIIEIKPEEFSFGRSLNRGIEAASNELVVIASAHVFPVFPDWIESLTKPFEDPFIALTYGKQRGTSERFTKAGIPNTTKFSEKEIFNRWFPETSNPQQDHPFCNNANAAIRRILWLQQPYDETLTGLEDLAWAKGVLSQGYKIAYVAEAEIIHIHNESPRGVFNRYKREAMAFKNLYPEAHFNIYDFARMFLSNSFNDAWHAAKERCLFRSLPSILWFRWGQFWGTYQGYRQAVVWNWQLRQTYYYPRGTRSEPVDTRSVTPIHYDES
jgi:glycosyltransferase involved in cell wall biosynthesis